MPWPKGKPQPSKGSSFWNDSILQRALDYVRDGWSVDYALSLAGLSSSAVFKKPFKDHPIFLEMVQIQNEQNAGRTRSFIVSGSKTKTTTNETRPREIPSPDNSLPCGVVQDGSTLDAESNS